MKRMKAKYPGTCNGCSGEIRLGDRIAWSRQDGAFHDSCAPSHDPKGDQEYWRGRAEGNRRAAERQIYGDDLVEQWELEAEIDPRNWDW